MKTTIGKSLTVILSLFLAFSVLLLGCASKTSQGNTSVKDNQANTTASKEAKKIDYPKKSITFTVPWTAGGSTDAAARALADIIGPSLGQSFVITNKDGANGAIATKEAAHQKGDGYNVIIEASGVLTLAPHLKNTGYSIDDFKAIIGLTSEPILLAVNADSPWKTLGDLLKEKDSGKTIKYGHSGSGSFPHLSQAEFFKRAGIKASEVPFKGGSPAMTALLGGHVDTIAGHPFDLVPQAKAGKIRLLGIFSPERFKDLPDVPTMKEQGYDIDMSVWKLIVVQKDTPDEIVKLLQDKFQEAVKSDKFQEFLKTNNQPPQILSGQEVMEKLQRESKINKELVDTLGLKLE